MTYDRDWCLTSEAVNQIARAMELADALEDCIDIYMQEIAEDDPLSVQLLARGILAQRLSDRD
ncbi:MAG: hypothetical protein IKK34_06855 [Clostridia bacterium]|nr:hypothetical protein [Clostridia bacterium]